MKLKNEVLITGFALFSMFFGAGNLILPPFLGFKAGSSWFPVVFGFFITAVLIPVMAIFAHAKIQGNMADFGRKISTKFGMIYALIVYLIAIALPTPRTAAVTHEIAIAPFFDSPSILTSSIYFGLVLLFALNRSSVIDALGKYLTPMIVLILFSIIGIAIFSAPGGEIPGVYSSPIIAGLLEGYQTFDAIGGAVAGGVLIVSLKMNFPGLSHNGLQKLIFKAGLIAGAALLAIYGGLILSGALFNGTFPAEANNVEVLLSLSAQTLGSVGNILLGVLVSLACFTTAVGIVTGTSDYAKELFGGSSLAFKITAICASLLGVIIGQLNVAYILEVAIPAINLIYPITIALIVLNIINQKYATPKVFKGVISAVLIFSIPDVLSYFTGFELWMPILKYIPLSNYSLGWLLPSAIVFLLLNLKRK